MAVRARHHWTTPDRPHHSRGRRTAQWPTARALHRLHTDIKIIAFGVHSLNECPTNERLTDVETSEQLRRRQHLSVTTRHSSRPIARPPLLSPLPHTTGGRPQPHPKWAPLRPPSHPSMTTRANNYSTDSNDTQTLIHCMSSMNDTRVYRHSTVRNRPTDDTTTTHCLLSSGLHSIHSILWQSIITGIVLTPINARVSGRVSARVTPQLYPYYPHSAPHSGVHRAFKTVIFDKRLSVRDDSRFCRFIHSLSEWKVGH